MDPTLELRPALRASDADRERTVAALRRHFAAGRLETPELELRVTRAYAARRRAELAAVVRDLPFPPPIDRARVVRGVDRMQRAALRAHVYLWMLVNTLIAVAWVLGGLHDEGWPPAVMTVTTVLLVIHARGSRAVSRRLAGGARRPLLP